MKKIKILAIIFFGLNALYNFGQEDNIERFDSIFIHSNMGSESKLKFIKNCENATIIADQDIKNQEMKLLIVGGIAPTIFTTDSTFEKKYQVSYSDYGDLAANSECMYNYNSKIFEYLTLKFGESWRNEIRKDVYGLKRWQKERK